MPLRDGFCISPLLSLPWAMSLFTSSSIDKASLEVTDKMCFALLWSKQRLIHIVPWFSLSFYIKGLKLGWIQGSRTHWSPRPSCFPCLAFVKMFGILFLRPTVPFSPAQAWESCFLGEQLLSSLVSSAAGLVWADKCLNLLRSLEKLGTLDVKVAFK